MRGMGMGAGRAPARRRRQVRQRDWSDFTVTTGFAESPDNTFTRNTATSWTPKVYTSDAVTGAVKVEGSWVSGSDVAFGLVVGDPLSVQVFNCTYCWYLSSGSAATRLSGVQRVPMTSVPQTGDVYGVRKTPSGRIWRIDWYRIRSGEELVFDSYFVEADQSLNVLAGAFNNGAAFSLRRGNGAVATTPAMAFDYYVDPASGSDANAGTLAAPFATLSRAVTAVGATVGRKIGLKRGTTLRNDPVACATTYTYLGAYGSGAAPASLGATAAAVSGFTKVGNLYTLSGHTFDPCTLALIDGSGNATKLYMTAASGTNSAVDPAVEGEWTWFPATHATPNLLKFYSTLDLTGYSVEVPQGGGTARSGLDFTGAGCLVEGIVFRYWNNAGYLIQADNCQANNVDLSFNASDGWDTGVAAKNALINNSDWSDNGRRWNGAGGPGDGGSAHSSSTQYSSIAVFGCRIKRNTQTGIGSQSGCQVKSRYCYFEDNQNDIFTYNMSDSMIGVHDHAYHTIVHKTRPTSWYNSNGNAGAANEATTVTIRNCTVYYAPGLNVSSASFQATGFTNVIEGNVVVMAGTCAWFGWAIMSGGGANATKLTSTNNTFRGFGSGTWQTVANTFALPTTETNVLTSDPLLTDPANGDFALQAGSPAINSGTNWGQTRDYAGNPMNGTPDRGAFERQL